MCLDQVDGKKFNVIFPDGELSQKREKSASFVGSVSVDDESPAEIE